VRVLRIVQIIGGVMHTSTVPQRLLAFDLLRGYLLFVIIVDHVSRFPSGYDLLTGRAMLWVTAAEGFFFISGMMVGLTRARRITVNGLGLVWRKLWLRSAWLYCLAVILTLGFTACSFWLGWSPKGGLTSSHSWGEILVNTLTLQYSYGWSDFLPRYAIFMFLSPVVAYLLARRLWWVVLVGSLLAWAFSSGHFNLAWQLLFFTGMIVGYYWPALAKTMQGISPRARMLLYRVGVLLALITVCLSAFMTFMPQLSSVNQLIAPFFDHDRLGLGRVIVFGLWFSVLLSTVCRYAWLVQRFLGWFLLPLGQNSLTTYILHAVAVYAFVIIVPDYHQVWSNFFQTTFVLAVIWALLQLQLIQRVRETYAAFVQRVLLARSGPSLSFGPRLSVTSLSLVMMPVIVLAMAVALALQRR
jgi:hypothetical protein